MRWELEQTMNLPASAEDVSLIPGLGRSPGGGHGNPLQYSCLENPTDRGAWRATVHEVAELDMAEGQSSRIPSRKASINLEGKKRG